MEISKITTDDFEKIIESGVTRGAIRKYPELYNALDNLKISECVVIKDPTMPLNSVGSVCKHLGKATGKKFTPVTRKELNVVAVKRIA